MHHIPDNLKALRKQKGWTQNELAKQLGVKRSLIGAYEEGRADPRISFLQLVCDKFGVTLDDLIGTPLGEAHATGSPADVKGRSLRILPIAVDKETSNENATLVPVKAAAGYLNGYGDVEFIEKLPSFELPFPELPGGRTYRIFQIKGDSMLPIPSGAYVICAYLMDWTTIHNDACYVIVSKSEGIVFKRVLNNLSLGHLTLKSDNAEYEPYDVPVDDILEVWTAVGTAQMGMDSKENLSLTRALSQELAALHLKLEQLEKKLN